jgi:Tfp pilus assembly pilus retraction ATPase PilT
MRDPFAYENNVLLIRDFLVPDPLAATKWEALLAGWRAAGERISLLEWIINAGYLPEARLVEQMAQAAGVGIYTGEPLEKAGPGAEREVLEGNGFLVLGRRSSLGLVTGGPDFPPDLRAYLGNRSDSWRWVMISPLRREMEGGGRHVNRSPDEHIARTSLEAWLENLLDEAGISGTADIHFERTGDRLTVRTRVRQGMIELGRFGPPRSVESLRYLKRLAGFTTADNPLPQDGRILIRQGSREHAYRASHIRTVNGESLVLRTIGDSAAIPCLKELGIPEELAERLRHAALMDSGLILCTGATGSGKSTTLFSLLKELGSGRKKILSIEDPVELEIPGVTQSSVDVERGWTFPSALRGYLRQDPDIIFVGEIRDKASAEGAARAALTGHVVLSTLHASGCLSALERLKAWGLPAGLIAETVRLVTHQRLVQHAATSTRRPLFQWMETDPDEVHSYLTKGFVPETTKLRERSQEAEAPSA